MANPQTENGFTKIANDLYEALARWHLSSYEYRVLIFIIRKTYGWNKKEDWISLSQFVKATNIKESHVSRAINLLLKQNIITKSGERSNPLFSVQKDYDKWIKLPKGVRSHHLPKGVIRVTKGGKSDSEKGGDTKDTNTTKETITKETSGTPQVIKKSKHNPLGAVILKAFEVVDPKNKTYYANTTQRGACDFLILEYSMEKTLERIALLSQTNKMPYFPKINSPNDLKEKWVKLEDAVISQKSQLQAKIPKFIFS